MYKLYRVTTRWPDPGEDSVGIVNGASIPGEELPKWRAYACALFLAVVGRTTTHVYEQVDHPSHISMWRWKRTFWGG